MEAKTVEIKKFITIRLDCDDLVRLRRDIESLKDILHDQQKNYRKYTEIKTDTADSFLRIIESKLEEL